MNCPNCGSEDLAGTQLLVLRQAHGSWYPDAESDDTATVVCLLCGHEFDGEIELEDINPESRSEVAGMYP